MSDVGFTSVKETRKAFEPQIAPELKDYLNKVWEFRDEHNPDLYKVYVGGRQHDPDEDDDWEGWDKNQATEFFQHLEQLVDRPSLVQAYGWLTDIVKDPKCLGLDMYRDILCGKQKPTMDKWLEVARGKEPGCEYVYRDLAKSFFHYRKEGVEAEWRVYLHVLPKHRGEVAAHLASQ